jgi:hypothetical protein
MGADDYGREVTQMRFKKVMVLGTAALAVIGSLTGAAFASSKGATVPRKATAAVTKAANRPIALVKAAAPAKATKVSAVKTAPKTGESENSGENSENSGESDGPGGHEDPPGQDVNNEFQGEQ